MKRWMLGVPILLVVAILAFVAVSLSAGPSTSEAGSAPGCANS